MKSQHFDGLVRSIKDELGDDDRPFLADRIAQAVLAYLERLPSSWRLQ